MPQFDFTHVFWPQIIWLAVFFAILYFGIVQATLPKLGRVMETRDNQVTGDIATAEAAKAEADRLKVDYDNGVAAAQDTARVRLGAARTEATKAIEAKLAAANAVIEARTTEAQASLATARTKALGEIESVAADAAATIVEKLTGARPADDLAAAATRAALG
ncbi:MAG: ATPase [Sphingomonas sp.]|nr:ATPase [Sphingomonas sp.]